MHGLRPSLNEPLVRMDDQSAAPARAAIVLFDDGYGQLSLAVAVRSRTSREAAFFLHQHPMPPENSIEASLEVGVTFAESMGFLFDEDVVAGHGSRGHERAAAIWEQLLGLAPSPASVATPGDLDLENGDELEMLDEEVLELEDGSIFDEPLEGGQPSARSGGSASAAEPPARASLSKFRGPAVVAPKRAKKADPGNTAALGRVAIVRRRVGGDDKPSSLIRLLSSF